MSKHNLNDAKETVGGAAAMVFGALVSTMQAIDPDCNDRLEIALNVRQHEGVYYARWECRWMDLKTDKIHTASSSLLTKDAPPMAYWETLENLKKVAVSTRKQLQTENEA